MTVMSVSEIYSQANTPVQRDSSVMGKDDFLTLLVAQLQHQDPLNPADGTEYTAQLAQFSSLEELQNISDTINGQKVYQSTLNNIESTNFIGKTITATGETFGVQDGTPNPIHFTLDSDAESVFVQIYDSFGGFVSDIDAGSMPAGEGQVNWDGKNEDGDTVSDGSYSFTVMATNSDGTIVGSTSYSTGIVTGVDYSSGDTQLLINNQKIPIASVIRIAEASTEDGV